MSKLVTKNFKIVGMKHRGAFADYAKLVPQAAQRFLQRAANLSGTEVTVYEPKLDENHFEGTFYVGLLVDDEINIPEGMEQLQFEHSYAMIRGKDAEIGNLYSTLDRWIAEQGCQRDTQENYIVETYHPWENGAEEVEIHIPIKK